MTLNPIVPDKHNQQRSAHDVATKLAELIGKGTKKEWKKNLPLLIY